MTYLKVQEQQREEPFTHLSEMVIKWQLLLSVQLSLSLYHKACGTLDTTFRLFLQAYS